MWKFAELAYERPDAEKLQSDFTALTAQFENAATFEEANEIYLKTCALIDDFSTTYVICSIRNSVDTTNTFYDDEMRFLNGVRASFSALSKRLNEATLNTPFRAQFTQAYGEYFFTTKALEMKTQSEKIVPDLIAESELRNEYTKTIATCETDFMGEKCNFYGLLRYMENPDREIRKNALAAWSALYESIADKLDGYYDKLIDIRLRMAQKLGFENYTQLAYANMGRTDYGAQDVASFRKQVREVIVPAAQRYREAQAKRIGVDTLRFYDEAFMFPDGNADPIGGEDVLIPIAQQMYRELSPETGEFFDFMVQHDLFDLTTKPGKQFGGYCTYLSNYQAPFIFSNFNGTSADTGVLTHEAGHAFAGYCAMRAQPLSEYTHTTSETAEIHSMTMEHFTYPWFGKLYGDENAAKAKYAHLLDAFLSIPYLVSVDEFQHRVFENPKMSAKERRAVWKEIEGIYMPWRDYDGLPFLEEGGFWMQKQHIFMYPFYYIDYALAQVCAFAFYGQMKENWDKAWADYLRLCKAGGSRSYFSLLKLAGLPNPFTPGSVKKAVAHVIEELDAQ